MNRAVMKRIIARIVLGLGGSLESVLEYGERDGWQTVRATARYLRLGRLMLRLSP